MFAVEIATVLDESSENYSEKFELVALPFIPRKEEKILWNGQLYIVLDVMYGFETNEEDYDFVISPEIQTAIASGISCKVWIEEVN
ncbi:hypothetical protein EA459_04295 [Streptococcus dysgalactiae subsp. dysgalactiae]|nr:hypothetical protein [Streptococcus dysgalactiae]QGG97916.1 hypothetical protein EA459_04295 [Streptococcus dysgalactiae subsp. dysgalactiae]